MKQQIIPGLKKKLLLVEFPEGASKIEISVLGDIMFEKGSSLDVLWLPDDILVKKLIGNLTDIKEEQFTEYVEKEFDTFRDYTQEDSVGSFVVNTAKESFFSKLEADGIYFENHLSEFPTKKNTGLEYGMEYISKVASWEEVQEKVWDKERTLLFEIM